MCRNLTTQVQSIAAVTTAVAKGNLGHKVEIEVFEPNLPTPP
jgi:osomolarity two-component system sensor histidine kinase NIK1